MRRFSAPGFVLIAGIAGCGGAGDEVLVDGSSTVFRISRAAMEAYFRVNPEVTVVVDNHGTGGGFGRYLQDEVDIVDASRAAKPDEESKAKAAGLDWTRFLIGFDGITVVVHPSNGFVKALTVGQLKALWAAESQVKTWKDLDPTWPDRKIILFGPDHDSGTYEFFTETLIGKGGSQRQDVQMNSDDNTLVTGVAGDPDSLGYFGYAFFAANATKLRAVPIQAGSEAPAISPSPETILDRTYKPLARPLYLYAKNASIRRPAVSGFLSYYLTNVATLARAGGYVPPSTEEATANREALDAVISTAGKAD